ncbi:MAG: DNA repair protein RadC [Clostridiaceae bacterium]
MHEGHRERLRQTYLAQGIDAFHEHQALELLLTYAIPRKDVNELAHRLIARFGSLKAVLSADPYELQKEPGVGEQAAVLLSLTGALSKKAAKAHGSQRLNTPLEAARFCKTLFVDKRYEAMYAISLDKKRCVLHFDLISSGTLLETAAYPRLVAECALRHGANSVILAHNHPSGDATPSAEDLSTTQMMLRTLEPLGIALNDHIVVGADEAYSMTQNALLRFSRPIAELKAAEKEE